MSKKLKVLIVSTLVGVGVSACGSLPNVDEVLPDRKVEYKKSRQAERNLEVPPDLTRSTINDALVIPDTQGSSSTTLSAFENRKRIQGRGASSSRGSVLPDIKEMQVKRDGDQRWLLINGDADDIWNKVLGFWQDNGILLAQQDPSVGVIVTDWIENRANVKSDFITNVIRKTFDGLYSSGVRDQYRVRIERGDRKGTSELYLTHRGLVEEIVTRASGDTEQSIWKPVPTDHELEAEMLRRLMVYMGVQDSIAKKGLGAKGGKKIARSQLVRGSNGSYLVIREAAPRAWRLTGVALDRVGFAVEDRDRRKGIYFVRYNDPMVQTEESGMLGKLAFWKDNDIIDKETNYQVSLRPEGDKTRVLVLTEAGAPTQSQTAVRILTLLHEQIR